MTDEKSGLILRSRIFLFTYNRTYVILFVVPSGVADYGTREAEGPLKTERIGILCLPRKKERLNYGEANFGL